MEKPKRPKKPVGDSRPLHDSNFLKEQTRTLFRFLVLHQCPFPVSVGQLLTPNSPEVWIVANYLLCSIHSEKSVRTWSELAAVAREIEYPYPIAKGTPTASLQSLLGFLFWMCDLLTAMERTPDAPEGSELISGYLLSSYACFMAEDGDTHASERARMLAAAQSNSVALATEREQLRSELAQLQAAKRSTPSPRSDQLEAENQRFLVKVIAPLDERRRQLRAAVPQQDDLAKAQRAVDELEAACEQLAARRIALTQVCGEDHIDVSPLLEEAQELEHTDLSLRAELELAGERRDQLLVQLETLRVEEHASQQSDALREALAAAKATTASLQATLGELAGELQSEQSRAESALREDVAFLTQEITKLEGGYTQVEAFTEGTE